jgi:23S rRNA pseudouridine1911/1915/1917 synthase
MITESVGMKQSPSRHEPPGKRIRHTAIASPGLAGSRLDLVASNLFADYSRARLQKWIRSGELTVNGHCVKPTYKITGNEVLCIDAEPELDDSVRPQAIGLDVIHSDKDLLVINKPAGLVVHPAAGNRDGTLQNALLHFDPGLAALPRSGIVHRLDKDTSGVMVVARSLRAHTSLVNQLQSRSMSRVYETICRGEIRCAATVDQPIGRHPRDRKRMAVVNTGRSSVTHFRILQGFKGFTHLEVSLETGRTHQIRVHLSHLGFPVVGDTVYGRNPGSVKGMSPELMDAMRQFPRQALHARTLALQHPADGRELEFHAPLPADMSQLLALLRQTAQQNTQQRIRQKK